MSKKWRRRRYRKNYGYNHSSSDIKAAFFAAIITIVVAYLLLSDTEYARIGIFYKISFFFQSLYPVLRTCALGFLIITLLFCLMRMKIIIQSARQSYADTYAYAKEQQALINAKAQRLYINAKGYVFNSWGEFQHRHIAKRHLGRDFAPSEEVHHINGKKTDNRPENLCVLFHDDHIAFHAWLSAERKKRGKYPPLAEQREILERHFNAKIFARSYMPPA